MKGEKGLPGMEGRAGDDGVVGVKGERGAVGVKSDSGKVGPQMPKGTQGLKGSKGEVCGRGDKGEQSPQLPWKQFVWKRDDVKDTGLIQVAHCLRKYTYYVFGEMNFRNLASRKVMALQLFMWHMQGHCVSIAQARPTAVHVGFSSLMVQSALDRWTGLSAQC